MNKQSKRDFLKSLLGLSATAIASQAQAISILEHLNKSAPNPIEKDLIENPQKQILIAEKMGCWSSTFYEGYGSKSKCVNNM